MRRSPETTLDNSYFTLVAADFHNRMEDVGDAPYTVVGGLGLHAVTHAEEIDWDDRVVRIGNIYLPRRRENNGTVRDLDTLVHTTDTVAAYRDEMKDALGGLLVPSAFGLKPYGTPLMNTLKGLSHSLVIAISKRATGVKRNFTGVLLAVKRRFHLKVLTLGVSNKTAKQFVLSLVPLLSLVRIITDRLLVCAKRTKGN